MPYPPPPYNRCQKRSLFIVIFLFLFIFSGLSQLSISSFAPLAAPVGASVTISGNGFAPSNNIVFFGATKAAVTGTTASSLTVTVPAGATNERITVVSNGFSAYSPGSFTVIAGEPITAASFSMRTTFSAGTYPSLLARGDLDNDGLADMAVSNFNSGDISVFRNTSVPGTVSFTPVTSYPAVPEAEGIIIDDINSDGKKDIIVTSISGHLFSVFINTSATGTISFAPRADFPEGGTIAARGVMTGDVDGDGKPDVATADNNKLIDFSTNTGYGTVSIHRNTGTGTNLSFAPLQSFRTGEYPRCVFISDLDGDKKPDFAVTNQISESISVLRNNSTPGIIDLTLQQTLSLPGKGEQLVSADLDGDGKADLVATNLFGASAISIFRNTSITGSISFAAREVLSPASPLGLSIGDLDGDGKPDLSVVNFSAGQVSVYRNTSSPGTISFAPKMDFNAGSWPIDVKIGDVDGDSFPDLTVTVADENKVAVLRMAAAPPVLDLGNDTSFCEGNTMQLTANVPGLQYLWSTGAISNSITVNQTGSYWVIVTTAAVIISDTINITVKDRPVVDIGSDTTLCESTRLLLQAFNPGAVYSWSNGSSSSSLNVTKEGVYSVSVDLDGCIAKDTIVVAYDSIPKFSLGPDAVLCKDHVIVLDPAITNGDFSWQDGSSAHSFTVNSGGSYSLTVTNRCGSRTDDIIVMDGTCELYMPDAFTPNNDGKNDVFNVKYPDFIKVFDMKIFNRWGEVVYQSKDKYAGWNGTYKGIKQSSDNYVWIISIVDIDNKSRYYKGSVILIR